MPTQKPRIALTVPDEINQTLDRLYELTGTPKSKLIVEMLEQYVPILEQVVDTLEKIKSDKENGKEIAKKFAQDMLFDGQEMLG
ncbi:ribbon-helix-helix domain-containing protein, partial [Streptococcus macedonicus]